MSPSTIHRRIRAGTLKAERAERPQGTVWLVQLPAGTTVAAADLPPPTGPEATAPTAMAPAAEAMVSLIQTTIGAVLGPLVAEQAALRQIVERQADQLVSQAGTIGRLEAENAALRVAHSPVQPNLTPDSGPLSVEAPGARSWWSGRWAFVLAGIVLLAGAGLWLVLPR